MDRHVPDYYRHYFGDALMIWIVVPAYNEEKALEKTIKSLKSQGYNAIVVVDDCSKDHTYDIAKKTGVDVLRHIINRGQGAALQTGITYALSQGADIIVTFDADGQHDAKEIILLIDPIEKGKVDAVLGSRFLNSKTKISYLRKLILKTAVIFHYILYGIKLTDAHNGFRAFSRKAASKIKITYDRMEHASEIISEIDRKNISYMEVPVTIKYTAYSLRKGQSLWNTINMGFRLIFKKFFF
jgi:polyprenyl-phospho-N-acetylgalactosaminyl synthase